MSKKVYKKNPPKKNTFEEITDFLFFSQKPLSKSNADKIILFAMRLYTK